MAVSLVGEAAVKLRPETSGFSEQAEVGLLGPLGEVAKKGAALFGAAWGAEHVFDYLKDSVKAYSDTTEATTRAQTVFGSSFEEVQKMAEGAAQSMGQSEAQAIGSASTFGNLFRSMGTSTEQAASMSTGFVKLASDMASFNNVPIDQALAALQSGVTGQTRPLKEFGVNIDAATVKTRAAQIAVQTHGEVTGKAAEAQAAYEQIMKQTTLTQGDFTRTSMNLADQQRIIGAETENLKDKVGAAIYPFVDLGARGISGVLLPALTKLAAPLAGIGDGAKVINKDLSELTGSAKAEFDGFNVAGDTWATRLGKNFGDARLAAVGYWGVFRDTAKSGTDELNVTDAPTLEGFFTRIGLGFHGLRDNASTAWTGIRTDATTALAPLAEQLRPTWDSVKASIGQVFGGGGVTASGAGFFGAINGIIGKVTPLISGWIQSITPMLASILPAIGNAVAGLVPIISNIVKQIGPTISAVLPVLLQVSGIVGTLWRTAFETLAPVIPPIVQALGQLIGQFVTGLAPILRQVAPLISTLLNTGINEFKAILQSLLPIIPPLVGVISQLAQILLGALMQVLQALMPILPVLAQAFGSIAQAIGGALIQAVQALAPILPTLLNAFISLVEAALKPLLPLLPVITSLIPPLVSIIVALVNAIVPFLPLIVQVVTMLVQLAVVAIQPLLPIIQILANLLVLLVTVLTPIINIGLSLIAVLVNIAGVIIQGVVAAVSAVIGWFQKLLTSISGIGASISRFLGGIFDGLAGAAGAAFNAVTGVIKGAVNGIIGIINGAIGFINRDMIGLLNKIPGVNIPNIPQIPKLHEGGVFDSGNSDGEGLALLRDAELVATPEQQIKANDLLKALLDGQLPGGQTPPAAQQTAPGVSVTNNITQLPGESGVALAARVSDRVIHNLNNGVTGTVGAGAVG